MFLMPINGLCEAIAEGNFWRVVEAGLGLPNIRVAVHDVSWPLVCGVGCGSYIENVAKSVEEFSQSVDFAACNIEDFSGAIRSGSSGGEEIRLDSVFDISEVARLPSISIYYRRFLREKTADKEWDDSGILTIRALSWTVDIKVAEHDGFKPVNLPENATIMFCGEF